MHSDLPVSSPGFPWNPKSFYAQNFPQERWWEVGWRAELLLGFFFVCLVWFCFFVCGLFFFFFFPQDVSQTHQWVSNPHLQSLDIATQSENTAHNLHNFQQTTTWLVFKLSFSGNHQLLSNYYKIRKLFKKSTIKQT